MCWSEPQVHEKNFFSTVTKYLLFVTSPPVVKTMQQCDVTLCLPTAGGSCKGGGRWGDPSPAGGRGGRAGYPGDAEERRPPRVHPQPQGTSATLALCLSSAAKSAPLTPPTPHYQSDQVSRLVKVHGIIISATPVKAKATKVCLQCRSCRAIIPNIAMPPGLEGYALPRKCNKWVGVLGGHLVKDFRSGDARADLWVMSGVTQGEGWVETFSFYWGEGRNNVSWDFDK